MLFRSTLLGLAAAVLLAAVSLAQEPAMVTVTLPKGDAKSGRSAFLALSCTSCHSVAGEQEFPQPISSNRGPTLGRYQAGQDPARLAMSIFAPSHEITGTVRGPREDNLSPMPDFTQAMTVRQFLDIIAYLGSLTGLQHSAGR